MSLDTHEAASSAPELGQLLLDAKFAVPRPRPGAVSRASLVEAARSSGRRLVAVTAPAGYGKSTFLAQWAQAEDPPGGLGLLAALIIKDSRGQERAVSGDDRYVADYLYREALTGSRRTCSGSCAARRC